MSIVQIALFCDLHVNGSAGVIEIRSSSKPQIADCRAAVLQSLFFFFLFLQFPSIVRCRSFRGPKFTSLTLKWSTKSWDNG